MSRVEWTYTVESSSVLRALALLAVGAIGSVFVFAAALLTFVVAGALLAGDVVILAVIAATAVLFGRRLVVQLALASNVEGGTTSLVPARELLAASVAWAVVLATLLALGAPFRAVYGGVLVGVFVCLPVVAALTSEGYVDTDDGSVHVNDSDIPLAAVERVSTYDLGVVTVLRVHYHEGTGANVPRIHGTPPGDADRIRTALESSEAEPPATDRNPLISKTLYAFGVGSFAVAVAFAYLAATESGDAAGILVYVAMLATLFGSLFVWLGVVEG